MYALDRKTSLRSSKVCRRGILAGLLMPAGLAISMGAWDEAKAEEMPGEGVTVVNCTSTSIEGFFHQLIPSMGLAELGYEVMEPRTLSVPAVHQATAAGDCHFAVDEWVPLHNVFYEKIKDRTARLGPTIEGAKQGYLIDKKTADAHDITSLEQFQDPEIAGLFDSNGNGKADLAGANPGWGAEKVINYQLDYLELWDTVDHNQGEYAALIADTVARFKQGQPVFFYTWTPNWTIGALRPGKETVWLDVPEEACLPDQPCKGSTTGFPANDIYVLANQEFLDANPAAKAFLEQVRVPIADINAENLLIREGEDTMKDVRRHAEEWIAKNRDSFDAWLEKARQAAEG